MRLSSITDASSSAISLRCSEVFMILRDGRLERVCVEPVLCYSRVVWCGSDDNAPAQQVDFYCDTSGVLLAYANPDNELPYYPVFPDGPGLAEKCGLVPWAPSSARGGARSCDGAHKTPTEAVGCHIAEPQNVRVRDLVHFTMFLPQGGNRPERRVDYLFDPRGRLLACHDYGAGTPDVAAQRELGIPRQRPPRHCPP